MPALAKFALGMVLLVTVPRLCRRLQMPTVVGLLLGGVIIGPYVLGFFGTDRPIADFLAELGKLLLMFFAGLEIDLALFRRARNRSITFGLTTTVIPLVLGTAVGFAFGYAAIPAIVIGSLLASRQFPARRRHHRRPPRRQMDRGLERRPLIRLQPGRATDHLVADTAAGGRDARRDVGRTRYAGCRRSAAARRSHA
jgi:hypothetical protein